MSLLSIAQGAASLIGIPQISQVIGNSNGNVRKLYQALMLGGSTLCKMTDSEGDGWSILEFIHEFPTVAGQAEYDLPVGFKSLTVDTAWQKDKYWRMRGSLSGRQWQRIRNRRAKISYNVFRIKRAELAQMPPNGFHAPTFLRKFTLEPPPEDEITLVYEYLSDAYWVAEDGTTFKREPTSDTDQSLLGDEIHILDAVWRFKQLSGIAFTADLNIFEDYRDVTFAQDTPKEPIQIGYTRRPIGAYPDESDIEWCA